MKKFCIITYGCKLNQADSEIMESLLSRRFKKAFAKEADFIIINTCGVVEKTERKILKTAKEFKKAGKKVILAGCLPFLNISGCDEAADALVGIKNIGSIVKVAESVLRDKKIKLVKDLDIDKSCFKKDCERDEKSTSAIVAIAEGCLGACTYCSARLTRKKLKSYNEENIIFEIKERLEKGFNEIQLTSQDLAIFGIDRAKRSQLPNLLKKIDKLPGNFKIKLGMMNPGHTKLIFKDLLKIIESKKFYKFLHIPLQSGSDAVLKEMKRGYRVEDFLDLARDFRKKFKNGVLATDIIVGHPKETEKDFEQTVKILKKVKPDIVHIFKFSARPNTDDHRLKDMPDRIKKERSRILTKIFKENNEIKNKKFIGKDEIVLVVEKNKDGFLARTNDGRAVALKSAPTARIGISITVKITASKWNYLVGKPYK
ncbi:MAG: tRNA (N(6)-L-threonylcarbamoyladenosine(37)-C(2))-methylthiotransferase [Candidatus Paceibacterota bacterium]